MKKNNELLRIANEQAAQTQAYIQKDSIRQAFYNEQLLHSAANLLILTDNRMYTVMTSDVFFEYNKNLDKVMVKQGVHLKDALQGVLDEEDLCELLKKCEAALAGNSIDAYLTRSVVADKNTDWQIHIRRMTRGAETVGLNLLFVDTTRLVNALERAEAADKAKSNFLANMSHEIRTPMNAIGGMADFILRDSFDETAKKYASSIRSASRTLLSIINDILDISKIESGNFELIEDTFQTASLINDVITIINMRLQDKPVELTTAIDQALPKTLYADEVRLKQILINLLGNAVKFTEEGSIGLEIGYEKTDDRHCRLKIKVSDSGIGIKTEDLENIFSSFTQVDTKKNRAVEGTGLGLAISRRLIEMMGGSISVESIYGQGTVFSFDVIALVESWDAIGALHETSDPMLNPYQITFTAKEAKVLLVDDNEMNLDVAEGLLTPYGISVSRTESGAEALKALSQAHYDIVFLDHMMPVMDGVETLNHLRKLPDGEKICVIALTANALSGAEAEYLSLGFQGFLAKPIEPQDMEQILRHFLPESLIQPIEPGSEPAFVEDKVSLPDFDTVIDSATGLKYCMGNKAFYKKMLGTFVKGDKSEALEEQLRSEAWSDYRIDVHTIKSTARSIGAVSLSDAAMKLEAALIHNDLAYVKRAHAPFIAQYRQVIEVIQNIPEDDSF